LTGNVKLRSPYTERAIQAFIDLLRAERVVAAKQVRLKQVIAWIPERELPEYVGITEQLRKNLD